MNYLLCHADEPPGDSVSLTWWDLAMMHAPTIEDEMRRKDFFLRFYCFYSESLCLLHANCHQE
jgi:hypothetical protein